jgi:hypothetical protein
VAINVRLDRTFPGYGQGVRNDSVYLQSGIALSGTAQQTKTIPATGVILGTTAGKIRIKIYGSGGTTPALTDLLVQASDGTNTVPIYWLHPNAAVSLSTTQWIDFFFEYLLDTASTTAGSGGAAGQLKPGGATLFNILTTMSGTGPTAIMDLEIVPLI